MNDDSLIENLVTETSVSSLQTLQTARLSDQTASSPYFFIGASCYFHFVRLKKCVEGENVFFAPVFYQIELLPSFGDHTLLGQLVDDSVTLLDFEVIGYSKMLSLIFFSQYLSVCYRVL